MNFKTTFLLFLALIILGLCFYINKTMLKKKEMAEESERLRIEQTKKIFPFDPEDVKKIEITRGKQILIYQKVDQGWEIVKPIRKRVDDSHLEDFIKILINFTQEIIPVEENPTSLGDFNLDKPSHMITLWVHGNSQPRSLLLGGKNIERSTFYAKLKDSNRVFFVGTLIEWEIKNLFEKLQEKE